MKPCQSTKNQSTQKRGNTRNKMEGPRSKKTKEPPKRANHKPNIKFRNPPPVARSISNKERGGLPERMFSLEKTLTYCNSPSQNKDHLCPLKRH